MNKDMSYLVELQDLDIKIIELESSKKEFPITVEKLEKAISDAENDVKDLERNLEAINNEKKESEQQIINTEILLKRSQERLNIIKTNKEYDAIHAEIDSLKNIIASAQKRLQKFNEDSKNYESKLDEILNSYNQISTENEPKIAELKEKIATIDSSIAEVVTVRDKLIEKINKYYLRAYSHIRSSRKKGKVIGLVNNTERNCTVCFQVLQPQVVNQIRKGTSIIYCHNCGSILIWQENSCEKVEGSV